MKAHYLALLFIPAFSTAALATTYTGPGAQPVVTVAAVHESADDTPVVLQGNITQKLKDEKYEFKDATGTLVVEIDDEDLPAVTFNEKSLVKLTGEVDKGLMKRSVDVDRVEILN